MDKRTAGILMHISSLPSCCGIGDLGPAAINFANFLHRSGQSIWQVLPLNPTSSQQGYSPYSSTSSMAGNTLFISPEKLQENGLLNSGDVEVIEDLAASKGFESAEAAKDRMLKKAYDRYRLTEDPAVKEKFESFCAQQKYWLDDFALYTVIRVKQLNEPWYNWSIEYRDRHVGTLSNFANDFYDEIEQVRFAQFLFNGQWDELKSYCSSLGIRILGDLPYYVGYDSADIWANRDIFSVDEDGKPLMVAGVPPDAFNDNGQLWGMPVFKWDVLKKRNYDWWLRRVKKNLEWFDEIRLDHFRAFSGYWEVDAKMDTALNGSWKPGPGAEFFDKLKTELGSLPFVAEDLGEIDEPVYRLRDKFGLPGMNVLHFAFGEDMPDSPYIPHNQVRNAVVYTGTHDNNTTPGWFKNLTDTERDNLESYTGMKVTKSNVSELLSRMTYACVSNRAVLPMQDILSLDGDARMNMPSSAGKNWQWRMDEDAIDEEIENRLRDWCYLYDRLPGTRRKQTGGKAEELSMEEA